MSEKLAIDVRGLTKRFGDKIAVNNVDIAVPERQVWGFLGPNGSGKTTTIRLLCGLLRPDSGTGTCLGYDVLKQSDEIKREVGYMTQRFSFWEDLTVHENLDFVARLYDVPERDSVVSRTEKDFGLEARKDQLAGHLSGGWKQRLALAACMLHAPRLLLLDEPTAGVDPQARRDFWEQIHRLSQEGLTVLVSTHYMDEAERCDCIVYINRGEIVARGKVPDVIRQSGLITFTVSGDRVRQLLTPLQRQKGVEHAAFFGAALHVSGRDRSKLEEALGPYREDAAYTIQEMPTSLEDAFIHLEGLGRRDGR